MKSLSLFLVFTVTLFLFTGCLKDVENKETFYPCPAVVVFNPSDPGLCMINTSQCGVVAAPELNGKYEVDDCLYCSFSINYDHQPSRSYYTVGEVESILVKKSGMTMLNAEDEINSIDNASVDSLVNLSFINSVSNPYVQKRLFMAMTVPSGKKYDYQLYSHPDSCDSKGIPYLYVCAERTDVSDQIEEKEKIDPRAFDISAFISSYVSGDGWIKFYLKYQAGVDNEGNKIYRLMKNNPIEIQVSIPSK